mgnify:CR=1 FL=1
MRQIPKLFILIILLSACSVEQNTDKAQHTDLSEFNQICIFFDELSEQTSITTLSGKEKNDFIMERLESLRPDGNAKLAWTVIRNFTPNEERYSMFKQGVESVIEQEWNCLSMEALAASSIDEAGGLLVDTQSEPLPSNVVLMKEAVWEGASEKNTSKQ